MEIMNRKKNFSHHFLDGIKIELRNLRQTENSFSFHNLFIHAERKLDEQFIILGKHITAHKRYSQNCFEAFKICFKSILKVSMEICECFREPSKLANFQNRLEFGSICFFQTCQISTNSYKKNSRLLIACFVHVKKVLKATQE
jgi:hypothetical protein